MAMEYLDGCTLRNEIDTKGNLSLDRSIEVVTEVLAGLEHAHSKGVIHRDIKPDNIQILSSGGIKITDFGIARLTFQPNLTMDGQVFGTPSYMSPEQVVGREIDARSDLFSVGVMLYEMLSGHKPFAGDSVVSITYAIMNKETDEPAQVPYPIWQVISRALDKTPAMRYQSAAEMSAALGQAAMAQQSGAMAMPSPTQVPPNPYQQTAQPIAPPIVYPFNPYQQAAPPPHPQPMYPGFPLAPPQQPGFAPQPIPIYYPPPPRRPLLPPESVIFLKRVVAAMIIIGTLFLLVIVGFMAAISAINSGAESKRVVMQQRAAQSYVAQAKKYLQVGQDIAAENSLNQAISANPKLVDAHINLAQLHQRGATAQTHP
jgi:serine/threonine-protein kinase